MKEKTFNPVIKLASSSLELNKLIKSMSGHSRDGRVLQVFNPKKIINRTHLAGAYINAIEAFRSKTNISDSPQVEMLLFASMTRQISRAIEMVGAKASSNFILFADSTDTYNNVKGLLSGVHEFEPDMNTQYKIAKDFGITQTKDLDKFILQKIAIARIVD